MWFSKYFNFKNAFLVRQNMCHLLYFQMIALLVVQKSVAEYRIHLSDQVDLRKVRLVMAYLNKYLYISSLNFNKNAD